MPVRDSIRYPSSSRCLKNASSAWERASSAHAVIARRVARDCVPASATGEARLDLLERHVVSIVDSLAPWVEQGVAVRGVAKLEALRPGSPLEVVSPQLFVLCLIRAGPALDPRHFAGRHAQPFTATGDPTVLGRRSRRTLILRRVRERAAVVSVRRGTLGGDRALCFRRSLALAPLFDPELARPFYVRLLLLRRHAPLLPVGRAAAAASCECPSGPLSNQADASATFVACGPFSPCSGSYCTFAFSASVL